MLKAFWQTALCYWGQVNWGRTSPIGMRSVRGKVRASSGTNGTRGEQSLGMQWARVAHPGAASHIRPRFAGER